MTVPTAFSPTTEATTSPEKALREDERRAKENEHARWQMWLQRVLDVQPALMDADDLSLKGPSREEEESAQLHRYWRYRNHLQQLGDASLCGDAETIEEALFHKTVAAATEQPAAEPTRSATEMVWYRWWHDQSNLNHQTFLRHAFPAFQSKLQRVVNAALKRKVARGWQDPYASDNAGPPTESVDLDEEDDLIVSISFFNGS